MIEIDTKKLCIGDCILISGKGFVSRGIKWFTNSKYSHVAIYVGGGNNYIIEATAAGVEKNNLLELLKNANRLCVRRIKGLTVEEAEIMKDKAYSMLYNNYDFFQFISMIPYFIFRKLGFDFKWLLFNKRTSYICSELYAICAYAAGYKFVNTIRKIKKITPEDLYKSNIMDTIIEVEE